MTILRTKHVHRVRKGDRIHFYHRITREKLPPAPEERARRVLEINAGLQKAAVPRPSTSPGTLEDLISLYRESHEFKRLAEGTRKDYVERLDWLKEHAGHLPVATITREAVIQLRERFASTPRKADWILQVLRRILNFAMDRPSRFKLTHNPAARFGRLSRSRASSNRAWTADELATFFERASRPVATAIALGAFTGQRLGDVLAMTWTVLVGDRITIRQRKTDETVVLPVHPELGRVLAQLQRDAVTIVAGAKGRPLTESGFHTLFQRERRRLGFAAGLTFHGLRHTVAERLAEAGASEEEIGAVLGHRTSHMVRHYTRRASRARLAEAAMKRIH